MHKIGDILCIRHQHKPFSIKCGKNVRNCIQMQCSLFLEDSKLYKATLEQSNKQQYLG